jgi:hypothetical protein
VYVLLKWLRLILYKKLERVQWRGLRVSLALLQLTHTGKVEALRSVPPLTWALARI